MLLHYIKKRGFNIRSKKELNQKRFCGTEGKCQSLPRSSYLVKHACLVRHALALLSPLSSWLHRLWPSPSPLSSPVVFLQQARSALPIAAAPWQTPVCALGRRAEDRMQGGGSDGKAFLRCAQRSLLFLFPLWFAVSKRSAPRQAFASGCGEYFGAMLVG